MGVILAVLVILVGIKLGEPIGTGPYSAGPIPEGVAPTTPSGSWDLTEAMIRAARGISEEDIERWIRRSTTRQEGEWTAKRIEGYLTAWRAGEPIVGASPSLRPLMIAFARGFPEKQRDQWLERCLEVVTETEAWDRHEALVGKYAAGSDLWSSSHEVYTLEAVYNLASSRGLRMEAYTRWSAMATGRYARETEWYERRLEESKSTRFPMSRSAGGQPKLEGMPEWGAKLD